MGPAAAEAIDGSSAGFQSCVVSGCIDLKGGRRTL